MFQPMIQDARAALHAGLSVPRFLTRLLLKVISGYSDSIKRTPDPLTETSIRTGGSRRRGQGLTSHWRHHVSEKALWALEPPLQFGEPPCRISESS